MKPTKVGAAVSTAVASWQQQGAGSQIPLPLRRGSSKSDKGQESDSVEADTSSKERSSSRRISSEKTGGKTSILGSTSFCCASGQKDDCVVETKVLARPVKKKPPKNSSKRERDCDGSSVNGSKSVTAPRSRSTKVENDLAKEKPKKEWRQTSESPISKLCQPHSPTSGKRTSQRVNNRLLDNKKISPERLQTEDLMAAVREETRSTSETELARDQKYTAVIREIHKDPAESITNNLMSTNFESNKLYGKLTNVGIRDKNRDRDSVVDPAAGEVVDKVAVANSEAFASLGPKVSNPEVVVLDQKVDIMIRSCDTDDLDCPCCNLEQNEEMFVVETCDTDDKVKLSTGTRNYCQCRCEGGGDVKKVSELEFEVRALKTELDSERECLRNQRQQILELQEDVKTMEQLKQDLIKERNTRKESEQKLLDLMEKEKVGRSTTTMAFPVQTADPETMETAKSENSKVEGGTPSLLLGYESRVRKYQAYITKLEQDNAMLVNELKKLKDLSPCSQGEQAKLLLAKLGQLERDNQQQQIEYESCLDDVANKLVHTLLIQKRLEEECHLLRLRVEQLEQENSELMNRCDCEKREALTDCGNSPSTGDDINDQEIPSIIPEYSERVVEQMNCLSLTLPSSEMRRISRDTPLTSPDSQRSQISSLSPNEKTNGASRIPAFNTPKPSPSRKRTKGEASNSVTGKPRMYRSPLPETTSSEESSSPRNKVPPPTKVVLSSNTGKTDTANSHNSSQQHSDPTETSTTKLPSVKRKRATKCGNLGEKSTKEARPSSKSQHVRWDSKVNRQSRLEKVSESFTTFPKTATVLPVARLPTANKSQQVQEVWNFSFVVDNEPLLHDSANADKWKLSSAAVGKGCLDENYEDELNDDVCKLPSPCRDAESSISIEGTHRTRDEGYSTMSSDQQQDSVADTTVSEQEDASATYIPAQLGSRFVSDDSVTECLDGSMTSSSDSGFGPLQQVAVSSNISFLTDSSDSRKISDCSITSGAASPLLCKNEAIISTISTYLEDHSEKASATITTGQPSINKSTNKFFEDSSVSVSKGNNVYTHSCFIDELRSQPFTMPSSTISFTSHNVHAPSFYTQSFVPQPTHNIFIRSESNRNSSALQVISPSTVACASNTEWDCSAMQSSEKQGNKDERVETAEKATLTEPEEATWREKALAHFIDESIWSLYSSESDTQVRLFSTDPSREFSPFDTNSETNPPCVNSPPKIVITEGSDSNCTSHRSSVFNGTQTTRTSGQLALELPALLTSTTPDATSSDFSNWTRLRPFSRGLERVASDSVLCLKDAVHELEDSMKPGLKMTKNFKASKHIPFFSHFSAADVSVVNASTLGHDTATSPEILLNLEKTMLQDNYAWPSSVNPSRSSSVCSLQSSTSCHLISDETDDVDAMRQPSRKGSQDPDLSSASDAEYENLDHKDFVERWIQKEIAQKLSPDHQNFSDEYQKDKTPGKRKFFHPSMRTPKDPAATAASLLRSLSMRNSALKKDESCAAPTALDRSRPDLFAPFLAIPCSDEVSSSSTSSLVYPIIFTCENIDDDSDSSPNLNDIEVDLELLDAEVKEFNGEFYKLCSVGSSLSLDHAFPTIFGKVENNLLDFPLKQYPPPPPPARCKLPNMQTTSAKTSPKKKENQSLLEVNSKPTGYVKPIRPVTLTFSNVPTSLNFNLFQKKNQLKISEYGDDTPAEPATDYRKLDSQNSNLIPSTKPKVLSVNIPHTSKQPSNFKSPNVNAVNQTGISSSFKCSYRQKSSLPVNQKSEKSPIKCPQECRNRQKSKSFSSSWKEEGSKDVISPSQEGIEIIASERNSIDTASYSGEQGVLHKRHVGRRDRRGSRQSGETKEGCGTAWVHLHADPNLADPKVRASFLDSMVETISSSGSSSEDEACDLLPVQSTSHMQRLCREKRQRIKASRGDDFLALSPRHRVSVLNRHSLYYRFGDQEKAAMACFDFLEDIPTSSSEPGSLEAFHKRFTPPTDLDTGGNCSRNASSKERVNLVSPRASDANSPRFRSRASSFTSRLRVPVLWNKPLSHNMSSSTLNSQDYELLDHISLSDSCAESYSSTPDSFEDAT